MIDPNHKAASTVGIGGTALTAFLDWIGKVDWAHITGFLTAIFVFLQICGWVADRVEKWRKSRK